MVLNVLKVPDARLTTVCRPVEDYGSERLEKLIQDLFDTMYHYHGVGLAACQVGDLDNVFVMDVRDNGQPHNPIAFINAEIMVKQGETSGQEGCLSIPGAFLFVNRAYSVQVIARNIDGDHFANTFRGLEARVIQHELDHTQGILIYDRAVEYAAQRMSS